MCFDREAPLSSPPPPVHNVIRLVNGPNASSGRVEVLVNGVWGTVCDDYWNDNDFPNSSGLNNANVACKMLGFPGGGKPVPRAGFGQGAVNIHLDNVKCLGFESSLIDCPRRASGNDCTHAEDVGRYILLVITP